MAGRALMIAAAGAGYLLLTPEGRARVSRAVAALRPTAGGDRAPRPQALAPYAPAMVDRRHLADAAVPAHPGHGTTATEVAVEFYEENPPA